MAPIIFGRTGRARRLRLVFGPLALAMLMGLAMIPNALAVHDTGAFQLDGNAQTSDLGTPPSTGADDWDRVCHEVTITKDTTNSIPDQCASASNTTNSSAVSFTQEPLRASTIFTGGGSKDPQNVSAWKWKDGAGGLPDKDNLRDSFAVRYSRPITPECPAIGTATTCELLYFGSDRFDNSGDAQEGFWFFQNHVSLLNGQFVDDNGDPAVHEVGDLLILSDFSNGGDVSTINVYQWVGTGGDTNGTLDSLGGGTNRTCGVQAVDPFCGIVNPTNGTVAPWSFTDKSGNHTFLNGEFYEGGVNLSALSDEIASECFASFSSETRSSTSPTATLKDFVLGDFGNCVATMSTQVSATADVAPGTAVHDTATVEGNQPTKTPSGDVTFFLCSFAAGSTDLCDASDSAHTGTSIGTGTLSGTGATASANSPNVNSTTPLAPGRYCFRAEWPGDSNYTAPLVEYGADAPTTECFTVSQIATTTNTAQDWIPNDSATIATTGPAGYNLTGSVTFGLYGPNDTTCAGTAKYEETINVPASAGLSETLRTTNGDGVGTGLAADFIVSSANGAVYSWKVVYTPAASDTAHTGSNSACNAERSTLTITQPS
jgi:hypothetical protein